MNYSVLGLISGFCADREVILTGDYNLPSIDWGCDPPRASSVTDRSFLDMFVSLGLSQWVYEATYPRSGNILDLVLTSESDRIGLVKVLPPLPGCDHSPILFEYAFVADSSHETASSLHHTHRNWHKGNFGSIANCLASTDWDLELSYLSADNSFKHLVSILHNLVEEFVPVKTNKVREKAPWFKRPPTSIINHGQSAWLRYKRARCQFGRRSSDSSAAYASFRYWNSCYRNYSVSCQAAHEENLVLLSKDNPKLLHSYIRGKKVGALSVGPIRLDNGCITDAPREMVEIFASSFASVFSRQSLATPFPHQQFDGKLDEVIFPEDQVLRALQNLNGNTAMGPDNLHPLLLKNCAAQLAYPLHVIFTRTFKEGQLPCDWKSSLVFPIFKKGARNDPLNYRPIGLTSVCGKTFERLLCTGLCLTHESTAA